MNKKTQAGLIFLGLLCTHLGTAWTGEGVVSLGDVTPAQYAFVFVTSLGGAIARLLSGAEQN